MLLHLYKLVVIGSRNFAKKEEIVRMLTKKNSIEE